jgi:VanZ family protein
MSAGDPTKVNIEADALDKAVEPATGVTAATKRETAREPLMRNKKFAWTCVFLWMVVIFAFSAQAHSGEITAEYLGDYNFSVRKCAHMCEYAFLFFLARRALLLTPPRLYGTSGLWPLALCFFYAMTDEFHQLFVPGRSAQFNDVLIDTTGATICWLIIGSVSFIRQKLQT